MTERTPRSDRMRPPTDEQVEMLRLADDLEAGEKTELDTGDMCVVIRALRSAARTSGEEACAKDGGK